MNPQLLRILPEVILTVTGILIMLIDPVLPRHASRKPMGWLAALGTLLALFASFQQLHLPAGTAYYNTVQTDAFSGFFHVLIAGIVLASLLITLDAVDAHMENLGEMFALTIFGAVGSMLMTSAVELLLVFIALEISSISSYILSGFRRKTAKSPESAIKYFLLGSFATAFFLYGIALIFGATGTTRIGLIGAQLSGTTTPLLATLGVGMILIGLGFKVSAAPFHVWTPDAYEGAPSPVVAMMSTAPKAAAFAVLLRILFVAVPTLSAHWQPLVWWMAVLSMTIGNLGALKQRNVKRMLAYSSIAHAGYLLVAFTALTAGRCGRGQLLHRDLRCDERRDLRDHLACGRLRRSLDNNAGLPRSWLSLSPNGRSHGLLPGLLDRHTVYRWVLRQVLRFHCGNPLRARVAGHHRVGELGCRGLLLPALTSSHLRASAGERFAGRDAAGADAYAFRDPPDGFGDADPGRRTRAYLGGGSRGSAHFRPAWGDGTSRRRSPCHSAHQAAACRALGR